LLQCLSAIILPAIIPIGVSMILTPSGSDPRILVIPRLDLQNPVGAHELGALRHWRCRSCRNEKWQQSKREMVLIMGGLLQENVAIYRSVPTPHSAPRRAPGLFGHRKSPASNSEDFGRIKSIKCGRQAGVPDEQVTSQPRIQSMFLCRCLL